MKISIDRSRLQFYLWVGLAYVFLGLLITLDEYPTTLSIALLNNFWRGTYIVVVNFIFFEYSVPWLWQKRNFLYRIFLFLLFLWVQLMLYSFGLYAWRSIGIQLDLYVALKTFTSVLEGVSNGFPFAFVSMFLFGVARHIYNHHKLKQAAQRLLIEKQRAELNYLKSQTNPHFLFNTLNNIYSLARDKSDLAPESVLRLSEILRFMLYETAGEYIRIGQELKIIGDYIALEKLRYDDSLRVHCQYDVQDPNQPLPPLLLIPLVENAFKHGVSETSVHPFVDIRLSVVQRQLEFCVRNSSEPLPEESNTKGNIGLSNLRRQLELLYTDFNLAAQQGEAEFTTTLSINLASHV